MFDILYILSIMSYCVKQAEKTQNLSKIGGFHFFFSRPQAGLTNQDHIRHYDTRVPLLDFSTITTIF